MSHIVTIGVMTTISNATRRRAFPELTELRAARLRRGLTLAAVAAQAGVSLTRASLIERDPSLARPGELDALRNTINAIATEHTTAAFEKLIADVLRADRKKEA